MPENLVHILHIEDDDIDAEAVERLFHKNNIKNELHRARDGVEALQALRNNEIPTPRMCLVDLNLPRMNGLEFVLELRNDPTLVDIVAFVLTTSEDQSDRVAADKLGIAGYLAKSKLNNDLSELLNMLADHWNIIKTPSQILITDFNPIQKITASVPKHR